MSFSSKNMGLPDSLLDAVKKIVNEESEYQKFFASALKKFGVSSPSELSGDKKKSFYDYVDKNWKGKDEKPEKNEEKSEAKNSLSGKKETVTLNPKLEEEKQLDEKAVSVAQQKLMAMALAYKRGEMDDASDEVKKLADSMSEKDLEDFAKTKHKGLPDKVEESCGKKHMKKEEDEYEDDEVCPECGEEPCCCDDEMEEGKDMSRAQQAAIAIAKKEKGIKESVELEEAKGGNYKLYHMSYSGAIQTALQYAKDQGYEVDMDDYDRKVAMGPRKPSSGKTNSFSILLTKGGKQVKQALQIQVYNMDNKKYELNTYIS